MKIAVSRTGAVDCRATITLPLRAQAVWGQLRDFPRYVRQDFFHDDIEIEGGLPCTGANLTMCHRYAGIRINRVGRILVWRENIGYSYSDLSLRGARLGFPHVFSYRLEAVGEANCKLHMRVRGRWTAVIIPRLIARVWLWWVFRHVVRRVHNELMVYMLWRRDRGATVKIHGAPRCVPAKKRPG